jgi:hypothetical protein
MPYPRIAGIKQTISGRTTTKKQLFHTLNGFLNKRKYTLNFFHGKSAELGKTQVAFFIAVFPRNLQFLDAFIIGKHADSHPSIRPVKGFGKYLFIQTAVVRHIATSLNEATTYGTTVNVSCLAEFNPATAGFFLIFM